MPIKVEPPDQSVRDLALDPVSTRYQQAGFGGSFERGTAPAVVVVDFSIGFTDPTTATGADLTEQIRATNSVIAAARAIQAPVLFTTIAYDSPRQAATWLQKSRGMAALRTGSPLVEIDPRCDRSSDDTVIVKHHASAFFGTGLVSHLIAAKVDTVVVCGATTSGCVRATAVDAVSYGFPVLVPRDCVGDRAPGPHDAALFDLQSKYADVITSTDVTGFFDHLSATSQRSNA
ncbi:isochorismatase family protein [Mycobacterium sp. AMU20-3851]|uniref:isochorismatase family protein n=1 Tax=Mycobacterium sp. AMU20-3851 TaxID=3122055 RepID=UPI0037550057